MIEKFVFKITEQRTHSLVVLILIMGLFINMKRSNVEIENKLIMYSFLC